MMNHDSANSCKEMCKLIDSMITSVETFDLCHHITDKEAIEIAVANLMSAKVHLILALMTDGEVH